MRKRIQSIMSGRGHRSVYQVLATAVFCVLSACRNDARTSAEQAARHVPHLVTLTVADVADVRTGLPAGALHLRTLWADGRKAEDDPETAQDRLRYARSKVQDLRVAKSTFFALTTPDGVVVRNDQPQDLMAGKNIIGSYSGLKLALSKGYAEDVGSMKEARGVEGRPDGQWVAAAAVKNDDGLPLGLYVTGWSWTHYARRLEAGLKTHLRDIDADKGKKKPLLYVFTIVGSQAFGTREAPSVNSEAIQKLDIMTKLKGDEVWRKELEITSRAWGLAVQRAPSLGSNVAIAILRSET